MKKTLKVLVLMIMCVMAFTTNAQAYKTTFAGTPTSVNSKEKFTLKIVADEETTLASGTIKYDKSLFEFSGAKQKNLSAVTTEEGAISWNYTDLSQNSEGVKNFEFEFEAKSVKDDKTGIFNLSEGVFVTKSEKTYSGQNVKGDKNIAITVKKGSKTTEGDTIILSSLATVETNSSEIEEKKVDTKKDTTTKDNTTAKTEKLPQAGESTVRSIVLIAGIVLIVIAIISRRKAKNLF